MITGPAITGRQPLSSTLTPRGETRKDGIGEEPADLTDVDIHRPYSASKRTLQPDFWFRQPWHNPDMRGRVLVAIFKLESNGATDPNLYTWTDNDISYAQNQIYGAFTFWVNQASQRGIQLSFATKTYGSRGSNGQITNVVPTQYEPITRSHYQDFLWINDALAPFGYGSAVITNENVYTQNEALNDANKNDRYFGPYDRSFSIFVVYNPGAAPSTFADGSRAYAQIDGPYTMTMWNSAGWGPQNLGLVITHETGHIFWACDEYYDAPSNTGCFTCDICIANTAPRPNLPNRNCDYNSGMCLVPRVSCMMKDEQYTLCPDTPPQIGW